MYDICSIAVKSACGLTPAPDVSPLTAPGNSDAGGCPGIDWPTVCNGCPADMGMDGTSPLALALTLRGSDNPRAAETPVPAAPPTPPSRRPPAEVEDARGPRWVLLPCEVRWARVRASCCCCSCSWRSASSGVCAWNDSGCCCPSNDRTTCADGRTTWCSTAATTGCCDIAVLRSPRLPPLAMLADERVRRWLWRCA